MGLRGRTFNGFPKMDTAMGSPIIYRPNKEAMILFINEHAHHFKKDDTELEKVSIDATKKSEVLISN